MVVAAWDASVGLALLLGPVAAGRADRSLTPCQLTSKLPPHGEADGENVLLWAG